jgi:hypothetical protein
MPTERERRRVALGVSVLTSEERANAAIELLRYRGGQRPRLKEVLLAAEMPTREWLLHTVLERVGAGSPPCNWEQALRSLAAVCGGQPGEVEARILAAATKG